MQSKKPLEFSNLQKICQVIGKIKEQLIDELPHYGHQSLYFHNDEITTGLLNNQTEIKIHLAVGKLLYFHNEKGDFVDIVNDNISDNLKKILDTYDIKLDLEKLENPKQEDLDVYRFFAIQSKKILEIIRMNLENNFTLVHLWPHHFDFSIEWFADKNDKQIGIGISPGDTNYPMPYLYMNPWPFNEKILNQQLPLGRWHTDGWNGIKVEWSELVQFHPDEAANHIYNLFCISRKNFEQ